MKKIGKENIKESISILLKGIYAGIMIGIGGTIYLSVSNQVVGAILFAIGLLTICVYKMNLYTGMIGYILENKLGYLKTLIFTLLGNLLGTIITALLILNTRIANINIRAREMTIIKIIVLLICTYISLAKAWSFKSVISMLFMILGNSFGTIIMSLFNNKIKA